MEATSQLRSFFLDDFGLCQTDKNQAAPKYNPKLSYFATFLLFPMTDAFSVLLYENVLSNTALGSAPPIHLYLRCNFWTFADFALKDTYQWIQMRGLHGYKNDIEGMFWH